MSMGSQGDAANEVAVATCGTLHGTRCCCDDDHRLCY